MTGAQNIKSNDLIELPEVIERFSREVKEVNKSLGEHEVIKRFRLVTEEWTPQTGELSPTLKLRRNYLTERYKDIIAEIYFGGEKDINVLSRLKNGITEILKGLPKF
jgi:long-chain acyl-CoA synthetase